MIESKTIADQISPMTHSTITNQYLIPTVKRKITVRGAGVLTYRAKAIKMRT